MSVCVKIHVLHLFNQNDGNYVVAFGLSFNEVVCCFCFLTTNGDLLGGYRKIPEDTGGYIRMYGTTVEAKDVCHLGQNVFWSKIVTRPIHLRQ
jgi:hypothetical protein